MNVTIFKEEASCINRCNFLLERSIRHLNGKGTMKQRLERTILVHTLLATGVKHHCKMFSG